MFYAFLMALFSVWGWGQTTFFSFTGSIATSYSVPPATGWTSAGTGIAGGDYLKLSPGSVTSPEYPSSTDVIFTYDIASYSSGTGTNSKVTIIKASDNTTITEYTLTSASSATYVANQTVNIGAVATPFKIKIEGLGNGSNVRGTRLRNYSLVGNPVATGSTITATPTSLSPFTYVLGNGPSAQQSFTVSGSNLTTDITVTPPTNYEVSTTSGTGFVSTPFTLAQTSGSVASTTLYTRLKAGLSVNTFNENIVFTSTGATAVNVALTGEVTTPIANLTITGTQNNGATCVNTSAVPITYTVTNTGAADATNVTIALSGTNSSQFALSALSSTTIAANGGSATFTSTFTPTSTGNKNATLTITGLPSGSTNGTLAISGTGSAATSAIVTSSNASSISYNSATLNGNITTLGTCPNTVEKGFVYSTSSGAGNTYPNIIPITPLVGTGAFSYNLTSLSSGTTYYYRSYVKNANGIYTYSSTERSFTTQSPATQLLFENVPTTGTVNSNLTTFTVKAVAANGTTVDTGYTGAVTLTKSSGTGNMTGTTSNVSFTNGVASFADVKFDAPSTYTLSATSGTLPTVVSGNITLSLAPETILAWNFYGQNNIDDFVATTSHTKFDTTLDKKITRGSGAPSSAGGNSFRTTGFQNNGISVNNTDYFQTVLKIKDGYKLSLTSIVGIFNGTSGFYATPGVTSQFAYSFDNITYTLINNPSTSTSLIYNVNLSSVSALQNLSAGTTIYFRYYASGQTSTGGWGFNSPAINDNGLEFKGIVSIDQNTTVWDTNAWTNNAPVSSIDAIITTPYSTSTNSAFTAKNITIQNGGVLEITAGNTVNAVDVTVEDGGNLIQKDGSTLSYTGNFKVLKNGNSAHNKYAFWSSPVVGQGLNAIYGSLTPDYITEYDTPTDYFVNAGSTTSVFGKGYSIKTPDVPSNHVVTFTGVPNNGTQTFALSNGGNRYNLVGNPYPSDLNLDALYALNASKITSTFYFWDNASASVTTQSGGTTSNYGYATYNASATSGISGTFVASPNVGSINPSGNVAKIGQGFFVRLMPNLSNNTSLNFDNSLRVASTGTFFNKNNNAGVGKYWLRLSSSYGTNNTLAVTYSPAASNSYDAFDSKAIAMGSDGFYTVADAQKLIIQGRETFNINDVVPVGTKHFENGNFTIALIQKEGLFNNGQAVYLHDKVMGTYTDLQNGSYSFAANFGENSNRFEIVYKLGVLSTSEVTKDAFEVYRNGEDFFVRNDKNIDSVTIYDASGRQIQTLNGGAKEIRISLNAKGVYLVKAVSQGKEYTKKIIK